MKEWAARAVLPRDETTGDPLTGLDCFFTSMTDLAILSRTEYGDECLNWRSPAILEKHSLEDKTYDHNYCRNPRRRPNRNHKQEEGVWCYTDVGNTKALCDVPWCLQPGQSLNSTVIEKESIPAILTATIILGIASFFVTVVICLIVGSLCCGNKLEKSNSIELESQQDSGFVSSAR